VVPAEGEEEGIIMTFYRHYLEIGFVFCCIVTVLVGCASPLQKANKLAMTEPESAIAAYKQIMEAKPGSEDAKRAHLGIASTYYNRIENYEKGIEVYEEVANAYPGTEISGEANWAIAMHYFQAKDYEKAREKFAKVTQEMPGTEKASDAALAIAKCYEELKKFDEAANLYEEFSETHPKHRYAAQAGLDAGRIYDRELSNTDKAVEAYKHVASEYALSSSGREARESLTDMGVDVSELVESMEEEAQAADTAPQTTMTRSRTRRVRASNIPRADIGNRQRTEEQQSRSVSADFGVDPLELLPVVSMDSQGTMYDAMFMFANMNLQSHQYKEAGALYEKALELAGTKPWDNAAMAYFGLAKSYRGIGMDDKATQMFREAVKLDRKIIDSMITTGETYYGDEDYEEALSSYKTALGVAYHKDSDIYYKMGLTYQKLGDADNELESFERSVALKPSNNDDAIQHMAEVLYYRKKDATRAEMYDKEARGQGSNDYKVQLELANLSYKYGAIFSKEQDRDKQSDSCYSWAKIKYNNAERIIKRSIESELTGAGKADLKALYDAAASGDQDAQSLLQKLEPLLVDFRFAVSRGAISQVKRNQIEAAQKQLDELKVYDPNAADSAEFHYAMGVLALAQGNQDAGMAEIKRALEIDPEHKEAAEMLKVPEVQETAQPEASE
jgi:tetratricopeptide (TPR) repeat protein